VEIGPGTPARAPFVRIAAILTFLLSVCCGAAFAEHPSGKDAVLIVAFGTSVEKARISYTNVEERVKKAFPDSVLRWAWSARSLLKKGPKDNPALSVQESLAKLAAEGVENVSVLSLHVIPGSEYADLLQNARAFEGLPKGLRHVRVAPPLLSDTESLRAVARLLLETVPAERGKDEGVLFVGHGTHHPSGVYYPALQYYLQAMDGNAFVGTVEGDLDVASVLRSMKGKGLRKVWMAPLMTVAGDHADNDLFGPEADSWKQRFTADGIQVRSIAKGLGEYPAFVARWIAGLEKTAGRESSR
jgi:sirohydrochlorin cobaltochelatase